MSEASADLFDASPEDADLLLSPRLLLPVSPPGVVLEGTSVAISGTDIVAVGATEQLRASYPNARRLDLGEHLLMPGLVNAHGHLAMTLLRGLGEGEALADWLEKTIWPLEGAWVDPAFVRDGTRLAIAEMVAAGTTTASDMYFFPEEAALACLEAGFRAQLALPIIEMANAYSKDVQECFSKGLALRDRFRDEDLLAICFGPHSAYAVQRKSLERVAMLADEMDIGVQTHLHETAAEVAAAKHAGGATWIRLLDAIGLFNENLQAVHMTTVTEEEIELAATRGVRVVHCPHSNMKLASGICPVARFRAAGGLVGIGTDGAASNNGLDMFAEARLASLLAKHADADAAALPATDAIAMATLDGARVLGIDDRVGSIETGKRADLVAVDLGHPAMQPLHDVHAQLIHAGGGARVTHTFINGQCVYANGEWPTLDIDEVLNRASQWRDKLSSAGNAR